MTTEWTDALLAQKLTSNPSLREANAPRVGQGVVQEGQQAKKPPKNARVGHKKRSVVITLSHLPDKDLSPNARVHWTVQAKATKALKEEVATLAAHERYQYLTEPMKKARVQYLFVCRKNRRPDVDNLVASMKAAMDGLVDGCLIGSDDSEHLTLAEPTVMRGPVEMTVIFVTEV